MDRKYGITLARRYIDMLGGKCTLEYRSGGTTALVLQFPFNMLAPGAMVPEGDEKRAGAA